MKITLEQAEIPVPEVHIRGDIASGEVQALLCALKGTGGTVGRLFLLKDEREYPVEPEEISFFEARENKVFADVNGDAYEARYKLYELRELLSGRGFVQIGKSVVVNVNRIHSVEAEFSGNLTARLKDGKTRLTVSRKYVKDFRKFVLEVQ